MSVHTYIGARYVPRFMGSYDATQQYEALDVVDNGLGTSYISKKITPPGTPLTDTDYWAIYGASSGAIINLQNQIDDINDLLANRKFILIGDSFGYGITPPSYSYDNGIGWIDWFVDTVGRYSDVYVPDVSLLPGVAGFASSLTFLSMIQSLENDITDKDGITDIVVMGGTNDFSGNGVTAGMIEPAIDSFMTYCRSTYPNAHVKIGVLTTQMQRMYTDPAKPLESYMTASKYGAEVVTDGVGLYTIPSLICSDGSHLTQAGYEYYTPWVNDLIICGHTSYNHKFEMNLTPDTSKITPGAVSFALSCEYTPHFARFILHDNNFAGNIIVDKDRTYTARKNIDDAYEMAAELMLPEQYNVLSGGEVGIKNNNTADISLASTWRMYTTGSKKITMQLAPPVANAHSGDNDYVTVMFTNSAYQCIVPFV